MNTARFVLSCHSVGTSLPEIALSAWMSASSFAGCPRCVFTLTRNVDAPAVVLFQSSLIASSKMSVSGDPSNVVFLLSPTHLFEAFSSAWLSHKYSMGFVTGVPRNAKIKAASSGRFMLDPSSMRPTSSAAFSFFPVGSHTLPAKTQKIENSNLHGFELHRHSSKGTKLLLQVIKAIMNQSAPIFPPFGLDPSLAVTVPWLSTRPDFVLS